MPGEVRSEASMDGPISISNDNAQTPTQKDIDQVYANLLDKFDPAARRVSEAGALLVKALQGVDNAERTYIEALQHVVGASETAAHPQSKQAGQYLKQISNILTAQQHDFESLIKWYTNQVLNPLSLNVKTDGAALTELQKQFKKNQKAIQKEMQKGKKNGMKVEELTVELGRLQKNAHTHAMAEERKRYNFIVERHASFMKNLAQISAQMNNDVTSKVNDWLAIANEEDTHPDAVQEAFSFLDDQIDEGPAVVENRFASPTEPIDQSQMPPNSINQSDARSDRSNSNQTQMNQPAQPNPSDIIYRAAVPDPQIDWHQNEIEATRVSSRKPTTFVHSASAPVSVNTDQYTHSIDHDHHDDPIDSGSDISSPMYAVVQKRPAYSSGIPPAPPMPPVIRNTTPVSRNEVQNNSFVAPPLPGIPKPKEVPESFVVAVHQYMPTADNQISLTPGENIQILSMGNKQGWIFGESTVSKQRGWFPENYTRAMKVSLVSPASSNSSSISTDATSSTDGAGTSSPEIVRARTASRPPPPPPPPVVISSQKQAVHVTNYDTIPRNNPFSHVRLRPVITDEEKPRKYL